MRAVISLRASERSAATIVSSPLPPTLDILQKLAGDSMTRDRVRTFVQHDPRNLVTEFRHFEAEDAVRFDISTKKASQHFTMLRSPTDIDMLQHL